MVDDLQSQSDIIKSVDSWLTEFRSFVQEADHQVDWASITEEFFMEKLTQFLFSPRGARYKTQFKFSSSLECGSGSDSPRVLVSQINYQHISFNSASEWVPAMDRWGILKDNIVTS